MHPVSTFVTFMDTHVYFSSHDRCPYIMSPFLSPFLFSIPSSFFPVSTRTLYLLMTELVYNLEKNELPSHENHSDSYELLNAIKSDR